MLSVEQGQEIVLKHARPLPAETADVTPALLGQILAADVASDIDMPPYDKSMMDGYALRAQDLHNGQEALEIVEEITAGKVPQRALATGQSARIMTGAPIPINADAVVMIERSKPVGTNRVQIEDHSVLAGQNILPKGKEMRRGEVVLSAGTLLRPQTLGTLATVGRTTASVYPRPQVAIVPTGDEIVEVSEKPGPGQIRNGNGPMLMAQVARAGGTPRYLGIARDREDSLRALITAGLGDPILILSGGVSAGKLDLVPGVLHNLGVEAHFHKVAMKPGKPVFFGTRDGHLVFGLPGNPVSSLVSFEAFVRPAIRKLLGKRQLERSTVQAVALEGARSPRGIRQYRRGVLHREAGGGYGVSLVGGAGSHLIASLALSNCLVIIPEEVTELAAGSHVTVMPLLLANR